MGSSVGAKKKIEEEKNAPPDANKDKSKSSIIKDISKENESQKENPRTQSKIIDSKYKLCINSNFPLPIIIEAYKLYIKLANTPTVTNESILGV